MANTSDDEFFDMNEDNNTVLDTSESEEEDTTIENHKEEITENSDDNDSDSDSDDSEKETYTIDSPEYKKNKLKMFGDPIYSKDDTSLYVLTNKKVKYFIENIKEHGSNLQIVKSHYNKIHDELLIDENPQIHHEFIVVEYTKLKTEDVKSLSELLDGHHRDRALSKIYKSKPNFKIIITVRIIQCDLPESSATKILFRKLNKMKPFEVDFSDNDIATLINTELRNHFNTYKNFDIIKNNTLAKRPSIQQNKFNDSILSRLSELKNKYNINKNDINIKVIIANFIKYNNKIKEQKLYKDDKSISVKTIEKASNANCFISLVNLDKLVRECIGEEYN